MYRGQTRYSLYTQPSENNDEVEERDDDDDDDKVTRAPMNVNSLTKARA